LIGIDATAADTGDGDPKMTRPWKESDSRERRIFLVKLLNRGWRCPCWGFTWSDDFDSESPLRYNHDLHCCTFIPWRPRND